MRNLTNKQTKENIDFLLQGEQHHRGGKQTNKQTYKETMEKINLLAQGEQHHHRGSNNVDRVVGRRLPALQPLQGGRKYLGKDSIVIIKLLIQLFPVN